MTEDYKKITLDYITGNLERTSPGNNSIRDTPTYLNNFFIKCESDYGFTPNVIQYLTTDTTSNFIIYGNYTENDTYYGYIAVLNQNGDIETIFKEFDTGTKLNYINKLQYAEDGNIYGLDESDSRQRIILLNNVAIKTNRGYTCRLRNSYYLPDEYQTLWAGWDYDTPGYIRKARDKATYYLWGESQVSGNTYRPTLIKFVINVGSTNEWTAYFGANTTEDVQNTDFFIEEGQDEDKVVCLLTYYGNAHLYKLEEGAFSQVADYTRPSGTTNFESGRLIDEDSFYVCTRGSGAITRLYRCDSGNYTLLNARTFSTANYRRYLNYTNGILFDKIRYYDQGSDEGHTYIGVYDGSSYITEEVPFVEKISGLEVINNYGLYQMLMQDENKLIKPSYVNYRPAYSGSSYVGYNSLVPLHSELYSNGNLVFARNLYNKQVYSNMSVSTVEIPNSFLNDIPIQPKNLISTTMTTLASDTEEFTKNIYENTFINFSNRISVIDEDTSTLYPGTANYINIGINTGTDLDYEGSMIGTIRINYNDSTTLNQSIVWNDISSGSLIAKETKFSLYVSKPIGSIDFMNKDGTFTYITKRYNFELGKTYTITQKIRIE